MTKYIVTGATGNLGKRVVADLLNFTVAGDITAAVHSLNKAKYLVQSEINVQAIDYLNPQTMVPVFSKADVLVYIPSKTYNIVQRVQELENVLAAMQAANMTEMIFVSFYADQENNPFTMSGYYGYAPRRLAAAGIKYAVLKNSLYTDPLIPYLPELIERKALIYPVGDQKMSFISYDNSAEAIAKVAVTPELRNQGQIYTLTQNEALDMQTLGKIMTTVTGHQIGYQPVSVTEFAEIYAAEGDGTELASMYQAGRLGLFDVVTSDFETITGKQPTDMLTFLKLNYHE
ncbi:NAD(P)H-binding protein [Lentilactobacillus senioris]|uniref:NAD(P)H-binding protein n=1 Tax=Lentilactobacillus senioris TaxID=931534 RepID=UPI00227E90BC|nr:NAD(P)H-binding protein [Lentilactobacillus senioris]MCY9807527.1 NAD(P)H-binding protein [Lentilactobacillus senioris]